MAKVIGKRNGQDVYGYELQDAEVKVLGEKEIEIIGSTSLQDRDGEVIDINGWDLKNFKKNPVVLPAHNYSKPAIGKASSVKIVDGKLMFKIQFPEEGINPEADIYRKLYKSGFMKASSVGFAPASWKFGQGKDEPYRTFEKQELLELSLVSVPANPEALLTDKGISEAIAKGAITHDEVEILKDAVAKREVNEFVVEEEVEKVVSQEVIDLQKRVDELEKGLSARVEEVLKDLQAKQKYEKILSGDVATPKRSDGEVKSSDIINAVKESFNGKM